MTPVQLGAAIPLANGGFDLDSVAAADNGFLYMVPSGWAGGGGNVVVQSGNGPWGAVVSTSGGNFLSLQGMGAYVEQPLQGLTAGATLRGLLQLWGSAGLR